MDYTVHGILQARVPMWVMFPSPGDLPNSEIKPKSPALQADSLYKGGPFILKSHVFVHCGYSNQQRNLALSSRCTNVFQFSILLQEGSTSAPA